MLFLFDENSSYALCYYTLCCYIAEISSNHRLFKNSFQYIKFDGFLENARFYLNKFLSKLIKVDICPSLNTI